MKNKLVIFAITAVFLFKGIITYADDGYSWYFKPRNDGLQPEIIPEAAEFIDNHPTIFLGDSLQKKIYLTFDAGYENGNVKKILDILKEKNVPGAFFVLPQLSKANPELLKRMKEEGHLVCNHTKSHKDMSKITDQELFKSELVEAQELYKNATGYDMDKFYRPPEGRFSENNLKWASELGYKTVFWSLAYADWDNNNQMNPQKALDLLLSRTHNGCVVLLHPTSDTNTVILGDYIDKLREKGYSFCSLMDFDGGVTHEKIN